MALHSDTEIYKAVVDLAAFGLRASRNMPRDVKQLIGGSVRDETLWMAVLVLRTNIARDAAKVPFYDELLEQGEIVQFLLKRAFNNHYLPASMYADAIPLTVSVGKQANALRTRFVPAP